MTKTNGHDNDDDDDEIPAPPGDVDQGQALAEDALRKMNHHDWLVQAAIAFETQWKATDAPITPFRVGLVTRLRLAAEYVALLERDARRRKLDLKLLKEDLENALKALRQPANQKGTGA